MSFCVLLWSVPYLFLLHRSRQCFLFWYPEVLPFLGLQPKELLIPGLGVRRKTWRVQLSLLGVCNTLQHYTKGTGVSFFFTVCLGITYLFTIQKAEVLLTTQVTSCLLVQFLAPASSGIFFLFILVHQMGLWKNPWFSFVLFSLFCFHMVFSPLEMTSMGNGSL